MWVREGQSELLTWVGGFGYQIRQIRVEVGLDCVEDSGQCRSRTADRNVQGFGVMAGGLFKDCWRFVHCR